MSSVVSASYSVKSGIVPAIKLDKDRLHLISQPDGIEGPIIDRVLPGRVSVSHINHAKVIRFESCGEVSRVKGRETTSSPIFGIPRQTIIRPPPNSFYYDRNDSNSPSVRPGAQFGARYHPISNPKLDSRKS